MSKPSVFDQDAPFYVLSEEGVTEVPAERATQVIARQAVSLGRFPVWANGTFVERPLGAPDYTDHGYTDHDDWGGRFPRS